MALSSIVPASLSEATQAAESVCQSVREHPAFALHEKFLHQWLASLFACSPYAADVCARQPECLMEILVQDLTVAAEPNASHQQLNALIPSETDLDESAVMAVLRKFRHQQMLRVIFRDLLGYATLTQTLADLSELAESCIRVAERYAHEQLAGRFGQPVSEEGDRQRLIVLGMGKLGGLELNFSSDIDLILVFPQGGQTDGRRKIDNSEFFRKMAQSLVKLLGTITEDSFVFRVDLRLRPFGDSGPLVMNFAGIENYYLTQGREWERYAMIKARPVCGEPPACDALMELLRPFVYRRYLDYSAFDSLRELKRKISSQVIQKGMQDNIKLGPGGIREIEFIGQAYQLVRGGREPELQARSILTVLQVLGDKELLSTEDVETLTAAYTFLRRSENCLQMMRDQQQHSLPDDSEDQHRLCHAMGFDTWNGYIKNLDVHRQHVQALFQSLFEADADESEPTNDQYTALWMPDQYEEQANESSVDWLREQGFEQPESVISRLQELAGSAFYRNLSAVAQQRLDTLIPKMLRAIEAQSGSWNAFEGLILLMRSIAGRSVYLQILTETPAALALLTRLFSRSSWIAEFVSQHPIVIDELLDYRQLSAPMDKESLQQELTFVLERIEGEDLDVQMDSMRQFRQATTMRVVVAELEGDFDLMRVSDCLTWIAEMTLQACSDLVWDQLVTRHGKPACSVDGRPMFPGFAIVAYGKLGGFELGYASDLDLVFLHESDGDNQITNGDKPIENQVFFARLAQKIVHFITTLTPAGTLYEIDMRLRPNGQSGMLVSNVTAFEKYQIDEAWIWEHQALVRARVVVGNQRLHQRFAQIRHQVLSQRRERGHLRTEVVNMRERMRSELGSRTQDYFDLKQDHGGIADIEFMVQYTVLWKSVDFAELTTDTDNVQILERVKRLGLLDSADAGHLRDAYLEFRREVHKLALLENQARIVLSPTLAQHRGNVTSVWQRLMLVDLEHAAD